VLEPVVPARGVIVAYDLTDAVGRIALEEGHELRFGRSACRGFEPVTGLHVVVEDAAPHPRGGFRAARVVAESVNEADRLLEERDAAACGVHFQHDAATMVATANEIGLLTLTFGDPLGDRTSLRELLARLAVPAVLEFAPAPVLRAGTHRFQVLVGSAPFPRAAVRGQHLGGEGDLGASFVTLCSGPFTLRQQARAITPATRDRPFDAWTSWGLCEATRVAAALATGAQAVVVHPAGNTALEPGYWRGLLGDMDHPRCRPFGAYSNLEFTADGRALRTAGLAVWALPDVVVDAPDAERDDAAFLQASKAALTATAVMVHACCALEIEDVLYVPQQVSVGPYGLDFDPFEPAPETVAWTVAAADHAELTLRR
jgi:hypothetical protein